MLEKDIESGKSWIELERELPKKLKQIDKAFKEEKKIQIKKSIWEDKKHQWVKYIPAVWLFICLWALWWLMKKEWSAEWLDMLVIGLSIIFSYYIYTWAQDRVFYNLVKMREYGLWTLLVIMLAFYVGILPEWHLVENPLILVPTLIFWFFYLRLLFSPDSKKKL